MALRGQGPTPLLQALMLFPMAQPWPNHEDRCLRGPYDLGRTILTPVSWVSQKSHSLLLPGSLPWRTPRLTLAHHVSEAEGGPLFQATQGLLLLKV